MLRFAIFTVLIISLRACLRTPETEQKFLAEIYYEELSSRIYGLSEDTKSENWLNIIDFGDRADYEAGYIEHAENIELKFFIDSSGFLVNRGKAITDRYENHWPFVIYSSSNDTIAYWAAISIYSLGFDKVYFYKGGREDWQKIHGDFLLCKYASVKEWYTANYPFEDTLHALVDVHPSGWYSGNEVLEGHIPGAVNIPTEALINTTGGVFSIINNGAALTDLIPEKSAKIVVYYLDGEAKRAEDFLKAAKELEYKHLYLFRNGYDEWLNMGDTLTRFGL